MARPRGRLLALLGAGIVDSLILSMAWTVVMLRVTAQHGLAGAGVCSTAMLVGVALAAPFAAALSHRLDGRRLLRVSASAEAVLRLAVLGLLWTDAPTWELALCVTVMNVMAWTGYAGMRAEVAALGDGAVGITWYATMVAAVEAVGVAMAALLPLSAPDTPRPLMLAMAAVYVLGLAPTVVVAGGSPVPRAQAPTVRAVGARRRPPTVPVVAGTGLMMLASGPTLLGVALAAELHGRAAVGLAAASFTIGSLLSPVLAGRVQRRGGNGPVTWILLASGMVAGWALAPVATGFLCLAQLCSGLCMTSLEGLIDAAAADRRPAAVTAALARTTAGRALGSAAGSALLPVAVAAAGLSRTAGTVAGGLVLLAIGLRVLASLRARTLLEPEV